MRLLFDQNISHRILQLIPETYTGSTTVKEQRLMNAPDKEIWEFAKINNFVIVTQDSDFNDLNLLYGFPPKIIWIRTGNLETKAIGEILLEYSTEIENFFSDNGFWCFEILSLKTR